MKKFLFIISLMVYSSLYCFKTYAAISIIGGPTVRIPGIAAATILELTGYNTNYQARWLLNGAQVGGGFTFYATQPGTYFAQVNFSTNPNNPFWVSAGSFAVAGLAHNVTVNGPNPLNQSTSTQLCLASNASAYVASNTWIRNGVTDVTQACKTVEHPGTYTVAVTYVYGTESSILTTSYVTINASLQAPVAQLSKTDYNPVTPPVLTITNAASFSAFWIVCDDQIIIYQTAPTVSLPRPGRYSIGGLLSNMIVYTDDFIISKGSIPTPTITSNDGYVLTYENPEIELLTQAGYNDGYTWYFNGQAIPGAASENVTIFHPGPYTAKGCAVFPDGTVECKTSAPVQITGEPIFVNYVRKKIPLVTNVTSLPQLETLPYTQLNTSSVYADGFARPIQNVARANSPLGKDVTVVSKYDGEGRELKKYLPFIRQTNDGSYHHISNALQPLFQFYQQNNDKIANTAYPYAETVYELSPLNRLLKQGAPGEDWQLSTTHVKLFSYATNTAADKVWIWGTTSQGLTASVYYLPGVLAVTEMTDENGHKEKEFKDKQSHIVLSEKLIEGGKTLRTYFIYDDFGRLSGVIPPKTIAALPNAASVSIGHDVLARECFSYTYDERGRVTAKNIPGGGVTYFVYDPWDRVALTQQSNQRAKNKWIFNKYDALNRVIMTGEISLSSDYAAARLAVANFYAAVSSNLSIRYEELGGTIHGYTNRSYPVLANQNQAYSITYYDNYNFLSVFGPSGYQFTPEPTLGLTENYPHAQRMVTGSRVSILGTNTYLNSVNYYDKNLRPIQVIAQNHLDGLDRMSNAYDFTGKIVKERIKHRGLQSVIVDKEMNYDHCGRILKIYHTLDSGSRILLADNHYNEIGELIEKNIHSEDGTTFLQSLDYTYNIRGWLAQVNPQENDPNSMYPDLYTFDLAYTTSQPGILNFQPVFNGNIGAFTETRPTRLDDTDRPFKSTFTYQYDARDQVKQANYYQQSNPTKNGTYDLPLITYDPNGNILSLKRKGVTKGAPGLIDDLKYSYTGNQLIKVDDAGDQGKGFINK